jgi:alkylhydroperoxidase/carboxymuconolactone decarboxylase family protein YurZ
MATRRSQRRPASPAEATDRGPRKTHFQQFADAYPAVARAYEALGAATRAAGPLDARSSALVKLALAIGAFRQGAVHSTAGRAKAAGCSAAEIRHVVVLATTLLGFPAMMAAMRWVDEVLDPR